jgi:ribosomal protein S6--L-glutamate ligase
MDYSNKGYTPLYESKKANNIQVVFLSSRAEKTTKSSNSMFFFEAEAKKQGIKMITIDPSSSTIQKESDDSYKVVESSGNKGTYVLSPSNTIIVPRRTVLKNSESKDFMQELQSFGFFCFNTLDAIETCEDKFLTYKKLKAAGVPTPKTTVITSSSMDKLEDKVDSVGGQFPIVCKILNGTQGVGVFIVDSMMSLKSTLQTMFKLSPKSDIILQEKINSDYDLRVHVMYNGFERMTSGIDGFEVIGCMKRNQLAGDFRSNYSLGSTAEKGNLTPEQEKIAKMAAKATNCRWAGVDLICDSRTKQSYVIEVNSSPGTKGITTEAGDDVVGTIFNMFKDFKYTKYESEQVGSYETVTIKDLDNLDVVMKFDENKSFTELECSSVNAKDDDVSFVFNGATYTKDLSGLRKGEPMVEMNIKFNGTVYKNELVVLKQVNDNINKNIAIGGSKFLGRVTNNGTIADTAFILTDNTTNFEIPKKNVNESLLNETQNWLFNVQDEDIKLAGLRKCLDMFANGSRKSYKRGKWSIAEGGYDLDWQLYYNDVPFMEKEADKNPEFIISKSYMPEKIALKIAGVVEAIFDYKVDLGLYYGEKE